MSLPESWILTTVSELGNVVSGGTPSTKEPSYWNGEINWISPSDLTGYTNKFISKGAKSITKDGLKNSSAKIMPSGSIHFSSRAPIGYTAISASDMTTNQGFKSLVPATGVFNEYIYYYFKSAKQIAETLATGTTFKEISGSAFSKMPVPLAPFNEQHRIVTKIEELFSELHQGINNLKTAQAQLKVYRQALLKQAFEGKLTAEWRAQNADKLESASALQQRIQHARKQCYQQQLDEWQTNGKQGSKPKAPKPITPLTVEELAELPELPEGWTWEKIYNLTSKITDGEHFKPETKSNGVYFLSAKDIRDTGVSFDDPLFVDKETADKARLRCNPEMNDILIVSRGATVGRMCIVNTVETFCLLGSVILLKATPAIQSRYFLEALKSPLVNKKIVGVSGATAQQAIYLRDIQHVSVPVCSSSEQLKIIEVLETKLSEIDQLDQTITTSLQQAEALRQSILKKAFSGELVPQNIEDEPASILLEKIKAEKARQQTSTAKARSKKAKPPKDNVVPFPTKVPAIDTTELHAGLMALAYRCHEQHKTSWYFGHVKAEKISHMIESFIGIDLERMPIQDAAGPNDFKRLLEVESLARQRRWFDVRKHANGRYFLIKLSSFDALIQRTEAALGPRLENVNALIKLFVNLDTTRSEIVATLFAAWNNLLLHGHKPSDDEIVLEARDRWHEDKLKIRKERFSRCLIWMRKHGLIPHGRGVYVPKKSQRNGPKKSTD